MKHNNLASSSTELCSPTATEKPYLFALPDDATLLMFENFRHDDKRMILDPLVLVRNFVATHPRFDELDRLKVVRHLQVRVYLRPEAETEALACPLRRLIDCNAGLESLQITFHFWGEAAPIRIEAFLSVKLRIVEIGDLSLDWDKMRGLLRACPQLHDLGLMNCSWTPKTGDEENQLKDSELKTWSRLQNLTLSRSSDPFRRVTSHTALSYLQGLRELDLSGCSSLKGPEFDACATLSKITRLSVESTYFSVTDAARILPRLSSLQELVVSYCIDVDSTLWTTLPQSLLVLRASGTRLLQDSDGTAKVFGCGDFGGALRVLEADFSGLRSWLTLSSGLKDLEELYLADSFDLGDLHVEESLQAMPQLRKLNLHGCFLVGDRTAAAIAGHQKLSHIWVEATNIGEVGNLVLNGTFRPRWLHTKCPHCSLAKPSSARPCRWEHQNDACPQLRHSFYLQ